MEGHNSSVVAEGLRSFSLMTAQTQRVCRLAAAGYSDREIGRKLKIGEPTVKTHLKRAYDHLAISARHQLVVVLGPQRAFESSYVPSAGLLEVLRLLPEGLSYFAISLHLNVTERAVKSRVRMLMNGVGVRNRTELVSWWLVRTGRAVAPALELAAPEKWDAKNLQALDSALRQSGHDLDAVMKAFRLPVRALCEGLVLLHRDIAPVVPARPVALVA